MIGGAIGGIGGLVTGDNDEESGEQESTSGEKTEESGTQEELINPDDFQPTITENNEITEKAAVLIDIIRIIGIIVTVLTLLILGIKYMIGSASEKADYKKSMIPYLIGTIIFFAISQILAIIIQITQNI